jgi:outer membrane immunogenic protein
MRRVLHGYLFTSLTVAAIRLLASQASAADLGQPVYQAPPPLPPPIYTWTGWYAGVNAGWSFDGRSGANISGFTDPGQPPFGLGPAIAAGAIAANSYDTSGFVGGGQLGYNWQFAPNWVVGLETDFMGSSVKGSETVAADHPPSFNILNITTVTQKLDWLGTTRAKLGYASGPWLFYGTGGAAYGKVDNSLQLTVPFSSSLLFGADSSVQAGWAAGGGIEYGWGQWLLRTEYLHYDLGSQTVTARFLSGQFPAPGATLSESQKATGNLVRGAVSYRF